jgi:hypothetical protein
VSETKAACVVCGTPELIQQLCKRHFGEWFISPEGLRYRDAKFRENDSEAQLQYFNTMMADFVRRTMGEGR